MKGIFMINKYNSANCLNIQYDLLEGLFYDNIDETKDYVLCTSSIMDDTYWNIAYLKEKTSSDIIKELETKYKSLNRDNCLYIGRDDKYYSYNRNLILSNNYHLQDQDVYMILSNEKDIDINIEIKIIGSEKEYNDFMMVLSSAYNDSVENKEENFYEGAVTKCYYDAVKRTIGNKKNYHFIAYDNGVPVSCATLSIKGLIGTINNVGTRQGYWNKGYSKQVIYYLIKIFKELGGKDLILCTEHQSKNQSYYESIGFKELFVMEQYVK